MGGDIPEAGVGGEQPHERLVVLAQVDREPRPIAGHAETALGANEAAYVTQELLAARERRRRARPAAEPPSRRELGLQPAQLRPASVACGLRPHVHGLAPDLELGRAVPMESASR
jgi:hypothetical protein